VIGEMLVWSTISGLSNARECGDIDSYRRESALEELSDDEEVSRVLE